jgi:hypothetical protein
MASCWLGDRRNEASSTGRSSSKLHCSGQAASKAICRQSSVGSIRGREAVHDVVGLARSASAAPNLLEIGAALIHSDLGSSRAIKSSDDRAK